MGAWGGGGGGQSCLGGSVMMSVRVSGGVRVPLESVRVFAVGVEVPGVRVFGGGGSWVNVRMFALNVKVLALKVFGVSVSVFWDEHEGVCVSGGGGVVGCRDGVG